MKKILSSLLLYLMLSSVGWAQDLSITGRVTTAEDPEGVPGVNVIVKGTANGTVTDSEGKFTISAPANGTLVFSFIGFQSKEVEIGGRTTVNVIMVADVTELSEVVVTALGIERSRNELAYAAQKVNGDQITQSRNANFVNALSGKVAGLDIKTSNTMGGSTNVIIRGYKSITGNNQALFVIDGVPVSNANTNTLRQQSGSTGTDYGNAAADINADNIESVNILKGAAATVLYGSRATNGVIIITTKKGKKNTFDLTINSGVMWGKIDKSTFTRYQKEFGGGYNGTFGDDETFDDGTLPVVVFGDDASYGPRFDPNLRVYNWNAMDRFSPFYHKATPWVAAENDPSTFYETALSSNQSISISAGGDKTTYKVGYTRSDERGTLPNSSLKKDLINFSTTYDVTKRLTLTTSANYSRVNGVGRYGTGYNSRNPNQAFRQWWQTNVDIKEQREAYFRNHQNVSWNWNGPRTGPLYSDNPYWSRYENYSTDSRDHFFGYVTANYKVAEWFDIMGRASFDGSFDLQEERVAVGSESTSSYSRFTRSASETNFDLLLNFKKKINENISFQGLFGANLRRTKENSVRASTNGGLVVPGLYALSNSVSPITFATSPATEIFARVGVDGIFANATFGYKEFIFLEVSGRREKSTTLPMDNNTYLYPSIAGNFVFSNVVKTPWLSHGKLRANYAQVGNDAAPLSLYDVYDKPAGVGNTPVFSLPNIKNNLNLKPERTTSYEFGVETEFLEGKLGLDLTYYNSSSADQIIPVNVTAATGYTAKFVNSGEVQNKGIEVSAFVTPIENQNFSWTVNLNFSRNRNKVISLYGEGENEVSNYTIFELQGGVTLNASKGQPYGVIRGTDYIYTNGQPTVGEDGYYMRTSSSNNVIGNPNPDWLGSISNEVRFKNISLNFLFDIRQGGDIFSLDQWYGEGTGLYPNTAGLNARGISSRLPVSQGGGVLLPGVKADGSPNDVYGENLDGSGRSPFGYSASGQLGAPQKMYVYDGSYVKLRELAVTYSLPEKIINRLGPLKAIDLSLIGRNLWILDKNMEYSDPEEGLSSGNANQGYQSGAYPMVRTYGFNAKFTF